MSDLTLAEWQQKFETWWRAQPCDDASHDLGHFRRVYLMALRIAERENVSCDPMVLLAAAYFHDLVNVPKNSPDRSRASTLSAEKTPDIVRFFGHFHPVVLHLPIGIFSLILFSAN